MSTFNRRDFIKTGGILSAGILFLPSCVSKMNEGASYRFFTNQEAECVFALCEQIIPADNEFGGATDAGVIYYIDRQLVGYFKDYGDGELYRESIEKLQSYCTKNLGGKFQNLTSEKQIDLMEMMEKDKFDPKVWKSPSKFFKLIVNHTMQGFYGSPIHGGNKDYMSFDMLGLEYPLNIGQNRYTKPLHEI